MRHAPDPAETARLTRAERLTLLAALLKGTAAGTTRAVLTWLLNHPDR
ncbi:hypothetical protein [Actinomadura fibrosa]|uniref:Uncharacterized protein n=1 Tax=Actinomadura fibrosa TaxID=111802 RepID=A0ABW2XF05_9ACTN|nr:hypothetical protein [Actinomadura fibrosa]